MSHFDQLHPAIQHHIVNSLGWREMRPFQEAVIPSIVAGDHVMLLAPTAGGKTEAAFFPVCSRMLNEGWFGLTILYVCPIKALLNNLDLRLQRYCMLLGRRSALWHGDISGRVRRQILRDPPDLLLTTPESLEVMLVSPNVDALSLFSRLRVAMVDEVHAFAGDDRGWHLLSVLERITKLASRELQRIGLSATVGNPESLLEWLAGACAGRKKVFRAVATDRRADVKLDYVGSLKNAALVISRLHRGQKRLVFIDSRARAEELGVELRRLDVWTFVTHSSLGREQRQEAEEAFATREDSVIVATSVLELGVDVGNLDRVIQIDSPARVSSFLQRMGRTGRRPGVTRNCLFLATGGEALVQAAGLIDLWAEGYVEPVEPPLEPFHVLAQQLMALILQERGMGRRTWFDWVRRVPAFARMPVDQVERVVQSLLRKKIVWEDQGILGIANRGENMYGRRHFLELLSVFLSPPLFCVFYGRQELGFVDDQTFLGKQAGERVLLLGGRAWQVKHIDWQRRTVYVEPSEDQGRTRWQGQGQPLGYRLCQAIARVLSSDQVGTAWSRRAADKLADVRRDFWWVKPGQSAVVSDTEGSITWWTFAGTGANSTLAAALSRSTGIRIAHDPLKLRPQRPCQTQAMHDAIGEVQSQNVTDLLPDIDDIALDGLKFSECLPREMAVQMLQLRLRDTEGLKKILAEPVQFVS